MDIQLESDKNSALKVCDVFFGLGSIFLLAALIRFGCLTYFSVVEFWNGWSFWHWLGAITTFRIIIRPLKASKDSVGDGTKKFFAIALTFFILWLCSFGI